MASKAVRWAARVAATCVAGVLGMSGAAVAGEGAAQADPARPSHGGEVQAAGKYRCELVLLDNQITVYVTERDRSPVDAAVVDASAHVQSGPEAVTVALRPAGDNSVRGVGRFILDPRMRITVMLRPPGGEIAEARFEPMRRVTSN